MTIRKAAEFIKNADVRAGKIPGWPSKPETNGDPLDPNNMERCDAHVIVNDGTMMQGACGANAAEKVSRRGFYALCFAIVVVLSLIGAVVMPLLGKEAITVKKVIGPFLPSLTTSAGKTNELKKLIETFYEKSDLARAQDVKFLTEKFGWIGETKFPDVAINADDYLAFTKMSDEDKSSVANSISNHCSKYGSDFSSCLKRLRGSHVAAYLSSVGENPAFYLAGSPDYGQSTEAGERGLKDFIEKFPKTAPSYCDSSNRLFAESWGVFDAIHQAAKMETAWAGGDIYEGATIVGSMKELINHRIDGDQECKNLNITVLKVNSGAIKYLASVKARYTTKGVSNIATKLFFLVELDKGRQMIPVACANCEGVQGLTKVMNKDIINGINKSANGVVDAFEDSNMTVAGE